MKYNLLGIGRCSTTCSVWEGSKVVLVEHKVVLFSSCFFLLPPPFPLLPPLSSSPTYFMV